MVSSVSGGRLHLFGGLHLFVSLNGKAATYVSRMRCAGLVMRRASSEECPVQSAGEGQMAINALQVPCLSLHSEWTRLAQTTNLGQSAFL